MIEWWPSMPQRSVGECLAVPAATSVPCHLCAPYITQKSKPSRFSCPRRPRMSSGASAGPAPRASAVPRMSPAPAPAPVSRPSLARAASEATGAADRVGIPGFWRSIMADVVPPPGTRALGTAPGGATRDHATHHHHHHHHHHQHPPHPLSGRAIARSHTDGPGKMGSRLGHAGESAVLARLREPWPREGGGAGRDPQPLQVRGHLNINLSRDSWQ